MRNKKSSESTVQFFVRDNRERREEEEKKNTHKKNVIGFHIKLGFRKALSLWIALHFFLRERANPLQFFHHEKDREAHRERERTLFAKRV